MAQETPQPGTRVRNELGIGTAWMEIEIDPEGQVANLIAMSLGGDTSIDTSQLVYALQNLFHLKADFNFDRISQCLSQAQHQRVLSGTFPIVKTGEKYYYDFLQSALRLFNKQTGEPQYIKLLAHLEAQTTLILPCNRL